MDNIMVIDNSTTANILIGIILKKHGFSVINAMNGDEGINKVNEIRNRGGKISVCITDINMPGMDGIDFLKEFRKIDESTPVIVMSSEFGDDRITECGKSGASCWIAKPFKPKVLVNAIGNLIFQNNEKGDSKDIINSCELSDSIRYLA